MTCAHCSHPQYAGIRCGVCGRWTDEKERTESALQRLSDFHQEIEANTAEIRRYHRACEMALEALEWFNRYGTDEHGPSLRGAEAALREALSKPEKPE